MLRWGLLAWCVVTTLAGARPARANEPQASGQSAPQAVVVFESGKEGYKSFRIPAVIAGAKGTLLAFCEGRRNNASDNGDIDTVLKRSTDGGSTWGPLQVVADEGADTIGNPCPVLDRDTGRIWLPLIRKPGANSTAENKRGTGKGAMEVFFCHSDDEGATWSKLKNVTPSVKKPDWTWYATGPGVGIQLKDGRLVIPCNHRVRGARHDKASLSHVIFSDDHGKTWAAGGSAAEYTNECQAAELDDGRLLLSMRSHHGKNRRAVATSADRGGTWSEVTFDEALVEPACQASLLRLPAGDGGGKGRLLFSNPASTKRERMTVRLSDDGGKTWPGEMVLDAGAAGYSCLVAFPGGRAGCLYEKGKQSKQIVFARFSLDGLEATAAR